MAFRRLEATIPPGLIAGTSARPTTDPGPLLASVTRMQSDLDQVAGRLQQVYEGVTIVTAEVGSVRVRVQDIESRQHTSGGDPWQQG